MISSNLNSSEEDHLPNNNYANSQIVNYSLPSPTYDLLHHQAHLQSKDHHHHHHPGSNMQIYETNAFNSSNSHMMHQQQSSSLPVLTPLNLNLKYVEQYQANCVLSSGSDSESLNDHTTRAKKSQSLPHKKRLKKLNTEQFSTLINNMPEAVQSIVSKIKRLLKSFP